MEEMEELRDERDAMEEEIIGEALAKAQAKIFEEIAKKLAMIEEMK